MRFVGSFFCISGGMIAVAAMLSDVSAEAKAIHDVAAVLWVALGVWCMEKGQ